jgi:proton glutamate symport protein
MAWLPRRWSLAHWTLAATAGGIALGALAPDVAVSIGWIAEIFLRLVRLLVAPLLFGVLVPAIATAGQLRDVGRLGWRALVVFELATTAALVIGWIVASVLQPGQGLTLGAPAATPTTTLRLQDLLINAVPASALDAMVRGDVLQIVVLCVLFGIGALAAGEPARPLVALAESVAAITYRCVHYVMWLAPAAVCAALASTIALNGARTLHGLGRFLVAAWTAELGVLLLLAVAVAAAGVPIRRFVSAIREPFLIGFATSSSAAALPQVLASLRTLGVSPRVLGFVTPLSLTLHMNGAVAYLAVAVLFAAQASNTAMSVPTQILLFLMLKLTSKGATGVPRATVVLLAAALEQFGLPAAAVTVLLGVDALVDPIRTAANVTSHCAAPVLVDRWAGERYPPTADTGSGLQR